MTVQVKRAYDPPAASDGYRVLVDRIWPRGMGHNELVLDAFELEVGPSTLLRKWFGYEPGKWPEFQRRYRAELATEPWATIVADLASRAAAGPVTLLYAATDNERNGAVVLGDVIEERLAERR